MLLAKFSATLIGLLHVWFMVLEMFLWTRPLGLKTFQLTPEFARASKSLALNQGLYNGFLAAGLFYGVLTTNFSFIAFFLVCVALAGMVGGLTVNKRIFLIQGLPALVSLLINVLAF